jgi:hypothetical protein
MASAFHRPEGVRVTYRRMKFDFESGFDRYWHGGSPFKSLFWTQLSTAFDPGERFFIDSARALKSITDNQQLLDEINEFCKQEGHHTAQHLKFDKLNEQLGIDVVSCRRRYDRILTWARGQCDPREMLAVTCALEHFTSGFADMFFRTPEISEGGDPRVVALWSWHAAEEAEHRGTCFDLYRACGGNYFQRVATMIGAWFLIICAALINTFSLLRKDGQLFTWDTLKGMGYLFGRKGLLSGMLPSFFAYFKPGFHPWEGLSGEQIARWQAANERFIVNLEQVRAQQSLAGA